MEKQYKLTKKPVFLKKDLRVFMMVADFLKIAAIFSAILCAHSTINKNWASERVADPLSEEDKTLMEKNRKFEDNKDPFLEKLDVRNIQNFSFISCDFEKKSTFLLFSKLKEAYNLTSLNLSGSNIYENVDPLEEVPCLFSEKEGVLWNARKLISLNLSFNNLEGWCLNGIESYLAKNSNLGFLDLSNNELDRFALDNLVKGLKKSSLKILNLSHNKMTWESFRELVFSLLGNETLMFLDVSENPLDDNASLSVRLLLKENTTLAFLGLEGVNFTDEGWQEVNRGLEERNFPLSKDFFSLDVQKTLNSDVYNKAINRVSKPQ